MPNYIQDLAPLLSVQFIDIEIDPQVSIQHKALLKSSTTLPADFRKYFGMLHDSPVLEIKHSDNVFSLKLNDITTSVFADVLAEKFKLKISDDQFVFPLEITFETIELTYNEIDESGKIKQIEPMLFQEYLYEQLISVDINFIKLALVVWSKETDNHDQRILILIIASNIHVTESQYEVWNNIFGNHFDDCYNYFRSEFNKGRYLADYAESGNLIDEFFS